MAKEKNRDAPATGSNVIQLTLTSLLILCGILVLSGGILTLGVLHLAAASHISTTNSACRVFPSPFDATTAEPATIPPWGELVVRPMELERPEEYVAFETDTNSAPKWVFDGSKPDQVRTLLQACGFSTQQIARAMPPDMVQETATGTILKPTDDLVLSLEPQVRAKLYHELGRSPANHYMHDPFRFHPGDIEKWFADSPLDSAVVAMLKKVLYPMGGAMYLSDYEMLLRHLPEEKDRTLFAKTLSRQPALLVGLQVRPDSDIDKLLGYWGSAPGVQVKDLRPLFESLKRQPEGGRISLTYMLPPFARQRLYTFPLPSNNANDPAIDCHWSTMNFFNDTPDNRFANPPYTVAYINDHFYKVAKPTLYGDRIFLLNKEGNAIHSAVYIADDIVFTKNGNNFSQPWMLMHLQDMLDIYGSSDEVTMAVYRDKEE